MVEDEEPSDVDDNDDDGLLFSTYVLPFLVWYICILILRL